MEWVTNKTWEYRHQAKKCWHRWFAWYPITIHKYPDRAEKRLWWEWVERKGGWVSHWDGGTFEYQYRPIAVRGDDEV